MSEANNIISLNEHTKIKENLSDILLSDRMIMGFQLNLSITDEQIKSFVEAVEEANKLNLLSTLPKC